MEAPIAKKPKYMSIDDKITDIKRQFADANAPRIKVIHERYPDIVKTFESYEKRLEGFVRQIDDMNRTNELFEVERQQGIYESKIKTPTGSLYVKIIKLSKEFGHFYLMEIKPFKALVEEIVNDIAHCINVIRLTKGCDLKNSKTWSIAAQDTTRLAELTLKLDDYISNSGSFSNINEIMCRLAMEYSENLDLRLMIDSFMMSEPSDLIDWAKAWLNETESSFENALKTLKSSFTTVPTYS